MGVNFFKKEEKTSKNIQGLSEKSDRIFVSNFKYENLIISFVTLSFVGAIEIDAENKVRVCAAGKEMLEFPAEPQLGAVLVEMLSAGCACGDFRAFVHACALAAVLSLDINRLTRNIIGDQCAETCSSTCATDLEIVLEKYLAFKRNSTREFCAASGLSLQEMNDVAKTERQFLEIGRKIVLKKTGEDIVSAIEHDTRDIEPEAFDAVVASFKRCYMTNLCFAKKDKFYRIHFNDEIKIHRESVLFGKKDGYFVCMVFYRYGCTKGYINTEVTEDDILSCGKKIEQALSGV